MVYLGSRFLKVRAYLGGKSRQDKAAGGESCPVIMQSSYIENRQKLESGVGFQTVIGCMKLNTPLNLL